MIQQIFSIYDSKIAAYLQPFFSPTKPAAIRAITDVLSDKSHQFSKHPEDYILFHLGSFNDSNAQFEILEVAYSLAGCHELIQQE